VLEGELRVKRQRQLLEELLARGHNTARAQSLLVTMMTTLELMRKHLNLLEQCLLIADRTAAAIRSIPRASKLEIAPCRAAGNFLRSASEPLPCTSKGALMIEPLNHHDALIYVMVTMSAVDRTMTDSELSRIGEIVSNLPVFQDFDQENLVKAAEACGGVLSEDGGLDRVLVLVKSALPKKLRETAYAIALEVAAADLEVKPEETRFLEMLRDSLELDKLTTAGIERGIRARNIVL
jgi:tellurite resistance protein